MSAQPSETELLNCLSFGHPHNSVLLTVGYRQLEKCHSTDNPDQFPCTVSNRWGISNICSPPLPY